MLLPTLSTAPLLLHLRRTGSRRTPKKGPTVSHTQSIKPNSEPDPADATPLDAARWQRLLVSHPNRDFTTYVSHGLKFGFDIGRRGHRPALTARNLRSAFERADFVDAHLEQSHGWPLLLSLSLLCVVLALALCQRNQASYD